MEADDTGPTASAVRAMPVLIWDAWYEEEFQVEEDGMARHKDHMTEEEMAEMRKGKHAPPKKRTRPKSRRGGRRGK